MSRCAVSIISLTVVLTIAVLLAPVVHGAPPGRQSGEYESDWRAYGADAGGNRFSNAAQINPTNVARLQQTWTYRTGELGVGFASADQLSFEATAILAADTLYLSTPTSIVIALDPLSGSERWRYDPGISRTVRYAHVTSRGVSSWIDNRADSAAPCSHRIFIGTLDARLIALDGRSGRPCKQFGISGAVDLSAGTRGERGEYSVTSPPAIYRDLVIVGSAIGERSVVSAFDARTGMLRWSWDAMASDAAVAPRRTGIANAWSLLSVDDARGIVYIPTGSADHHDATREYRGDNAYANSIVALRAGTGAVIWHQQLVHHDLWDYDIPAQPMLVDLERDGKSIAAVVQATKTGQLFVFDRETGESVFETVERAVPRSSVPGMTAAPTQPFPVTPSLVSHAAITPQDAWGLTFIDRGKCRDLLGKYRSEGIFTPPSLQGTIMSPGDAGGVSWGGLAFDSDRQLVIAAVNHVPTLATLVATPPTATLDSPPTATAQSAGQRGTAYVLRREPLLSPLGLPCTAPPWGTLAAVDLRRNTIRWQVVLGSTRDMTPWYVPKRDLGMPNRGGPIITAGGLVFVAAATDNYLRAFDLNTGHELWRGRLPAGGQATPMSYELHGRQFIMIAAGGHGDLGTTRGDYVVAFALPPTQLQDSSPNEPGR